MTYAEFQENWEKAAAAEYDKYLALSGDNRLRVANLDKVEEMLRNRLSN